MYVIISPPPQDEIEEIVKFWEQGKGDAKNRVVLYNCTSGAGLLVVYDTCVIFGVCRLSWLLLLFVDCLFCYNCTSCAAPPE